MEGLLLITLYFVIALACTCPVVFQLLCKLMGLSPHQSGYHNKQVFVFWICSPFQISQFTPYKFAPL